MISLRSCVHNKIRLCAHDVLLYSYIQSQTDCINLQQDLNSFKLLSYLANVIKSKEM